MERSGREGIKPPTNHPCSSLELNLSSTYEELRCRSGLFVVLSDVLLHPLVEGRPSEALINVGSFLSTKSLSQKGGSYVGASTYCFKCLADGEPPKRSHPLVVVGFGQGCSHATDSIAFLFGLPGSSLQSVWIGRWFLLFLLGPFGCMVIQYNSRSSGPFLSWETPFGAIHCIVHEFEWVLEGQFQRVSFLVYLAKKRCWY